MDFKEKFKYIYRSKRAREKGLSRDERGPPVSTDRTVRFVRTQGDMGRKFEMIMLPFSINPFSGGFKGDRKEAHVGPSGQGRGFRRAHDAIFLRPRYRVGLFVLQGETVLLKKALLAFRVYKQNP